MFRGWAGKHEAGSYSLLGMICGDMSRYTDGAVEN